ncbi:hypothetical protein Oweho_2814 [Owenweeksia hongkongensis DSM 17368]|uniref:Uncharacterized protein n=1 Tax=Owenweeksia hongkongensis (strain DSM 17368 / CIP 108786 / JCM 12287 / NRRL B-23963 / UST20020801) TaxID=926562 RepID=G8R0P7_OWEHD|nr:hypothetical protein [Owenweeksia hongkongensis]AEV33774.1 hypothetical protein Oweho_2814 [Owenweeksia hongkongensis DSM 17368]
MTRVLSLLILLSFGFASQAQRYKKPEQYFREFQTQKRKINKKNLMYLKASLRGDDERRVAKYREMMVDQLKDSKTELSRMGNYEGYDILQREFVDALTIYIDAYEKDFGIAEELTEHRYDSYEDLKKYYDAVTKAEGGMLDASYKMEKAEDHFAKMHFFTIDRDEEIEEEYRLLDEVTLYTRDMTLSFFRVEQHSKDFLFAINEGRTDTLDIILTEMQKDIRVSKAEIDEYADFDGEKELYKFTEYFLEEMNIEVTENLRPLADQLENKYLEDKDYKKAQKELERFVDRHNGYLDEFFETKSELILDYLPED